jgi:L-lactate dehydrogenase complex protein LldE
MHCNTSYQREAVPLVLHFVDVFRDAEVVVSPSASCVGMVHEVYPKAAALPATPGSLGPWAS